MLGDTEIEDLKSISNKYSNFKTFYSGATSPKYSSYIKQQIPDINSVEKGLVGGIYNLESTASFTNVDQLMNNIAGGFDSIFSSIKSFRLNVNNSKINGDAKRGSILSQLIALIMGIIQLPKRFSYLFKSLTTGSLALVKGLGGITKSAKLGGKDIWHLIIAIIKIIYKYYLCILSFTITTMAGCILIHFITFYFVVLHLGIMLVIDTMNEYTGIDLSPAMDTIVEYVRWPSAIQNVCYTCFGKHVKLRDVIRDVSVIEDIGNKISYDFSHKIPIYMRPSAPLAKSAMKDLDKAIN
jgi:hypothetical protein